MEFWPLYDMTWRPQFWPEPKNDRNDFEMIFRELSNAAFRFLYGDQEPRSWGGVQTPPPPPQQAVEHPEAQQGAG